MNETTELIDAQRNLLDPKVISKQNDSAGRSELAHRLLQLRKQRSYLEKGKQLLLEDMSTTEQDLNSFGIRKDQLESDLIDRLNTVIAKLKRLVGLGDKKALLIQEELASVSNDREKIISRLTNLSQEIEQQDRLIVSTPDPKQELIKYYESKSNQPLGVEEKKNILTPELLASLSLEEYIKLWRRLNPEFLSHVTRQGFRDHVGMFSHSHGMNEFSSGLVAVLNDGKILRSPMQIKKLLNRDHEAVRQALSDWVLQSDDQTEAESRFYRWLNFTLASAPKYPDETAVHFAAQVVADWFYGGETGNEVFYIYPTDAIASQNLFAFNGWEKDFTKPQSEMKWNDIFVWPEKNREGIQLDAGIVFLPKSAQVDRETGSKYASQIDSDLGRRSLVIDEALSSSFHSWCENKSSTSYKIATEAIDHYRNMPDDWYGNRDRARNIAIEVVFNQLTVLGFTKDAAEDFASKLVSRLSWDKDALDIPEIRDTLLVESRALWKRATNPISSKEYWETYFDQNPEKKPKHIIYYDGTPSVAVREFQQQNGIGMKSTEKSGRELLGFEDNYVADMEADKRVWDGYDELVMFGKQIIEDRYVGKERKADLFSG